MADINLTVSASLAQFEAALRQTGDITAEQAKNIARDLKASLSSAEKAAKQSAEATKRAMQETDKAARAASERVGDVGDKFGKVGSSAGKLAGALGLVNPALGEAARTAADLADVGEVGALALGSLGTATAASAAVLGVFAAGLAPVVELIALQAEEAERAATALRNYQAATAAAASAGSDFAASLSSASDQIRLGLQLETSREQTARRTGDALKEQAAALVESTRAEQAAAEQLTASNRGTLASLELKARTGDLNAQEAAQYREISGAVKTANAEQTRRAAIIATAESDATTYADTLVDLAAAEDQAERNAKRKAAADRASAEASRAALEVERQRVAAQQALTAMVQGYAEGMRQLVDAQLVTATEEERILAAGAERIRQLDELAVKTSYLATTQAEAAEAEAEAEAARVAVRQDTAAKITALEVAASEERKKLADDERTQRAEADAAALEVQRAAIMEGVSLISDSLSASADNQAAVLEQLTSQLESNSENMTEADKKALQQRIAAQREAAMLIFGINKAMQLATATVNTATAVTAALASAPPPANFIAAGVAGAAGGVQIAAIAAQQPAFHSGGMVPDEVQARLVTGEAVLSRVGRNVIGDEQIRAANAGMQPMERPLVVVQQYRHKVYNDFARDNLRLGGPLASAVRGSRTVGMREAL